MPIGVLLVSGSHTHQENYARALGADPRCRLVAVADELGIPPRRRDLNERLAQELGVPCLPDLDAGLSRPDVNVVSVCCESERIGRVIVRCAEAGKHVYADKPLAASAAEARTVVAGVRAAGVRCQMFSLVHTATARRIRALVESGRLGRLIGLHAVLFFAKGRAGTADLASPRVEKAPVTRYTFLDSKRELQCIGVYPLVLFQWLVGDRFQRAHAVTSNYFFAEHQRNDVEDFAAVRLSMYGGAQASLMVGRTGWTSHPSGGMNDVVLVGTHGVATIDAFRPRLEVYASAAAWQPPDVHPEDPMGFWAGTQRESGVCPKKDWRSIESAVTADAEAFIDCVEQGREPEVSASIGAHAVEALGAAYESAARGAEVAIPADLAD